MKKELLRKNLRATLDAVLERIWIECEDDIIAAGLKDRPIESWSIGTLCKIAEAFEYRPSVTSESTKANVETAPINNSQSNNHVAEKKPKGNSEEQKKLSILVAEDNEINQRMMMRLLEKRGHLVTVAGDGKKALEALTQSVFDIVVLDIMMPNVDGYQVLAELRERDSANSSHTPVIALTSVEHVDKAAGFDAVIHKPASHRAIFDAIESFSK